MNTPISIIIITIIIGAFLLGESGGHLPMPFRSRACEGRGWYRHFPQTPIKEIREFLLFFVKAFAFSDNQKLKLNPDDKILEIYKTLYPSQWMPDALEFETLERDLRQKYSVELGKIWRDDLTLGDLFAECLKETANTVAF
jgi:propanediol dehydratase small subunit